MTGMGAVHTSAGMEPDPLRQFLTGLRDAGCDADAEQLADVLWLGAQLRRAVQAEALAAPPGEGTAPEENSIFPTLVAGEGEAPPSSATAEEVDTSPPPPLPAPFPAPRPSAATHERNVGMWLATHPEPGRSVLSFRTPAASSLAHKRGIARAIRPLGRRTASVGKMELDVEATAERLADQGLWEPIFRPALTNWLSVALVVDSSASMAIWREAAREMLILLQQQNVFRSVSAWELEQIGNGPFLRRFFTNATPSDTERPHHHHGAVLDPSGKRLILVFSDAVSQQWRDGTHFRLLEEWGRHHAVALVQVLPSRLWPRTALGCGAEAFLHPSTPGAQNVRWQAALPDLLPGEKAPTGLRLPVLLPHPAHVRALVSAVCGRADAWTSGYALPPAKTMSATAQQSQPAPMSMPPEKRVRNFLHTASANARQLAGFLAASPTLTLPVMRLIQQAMLPESSISDLAEVYLSGLLRRDEEQEKVGAELAVYRLHDGLRELLLGTISAGDAFMVLKRVSVVVNARAGKGDTFRAFLHSPSMGSAASLREMPGFAEVAAQVLHRLGGRYAEWADLILPTSAPPLLDVGDLAIPDLTGNSPVAPWPLRGPQRQQALILDLGCSVTPTPSRASMGVQLFTKMVGSDSSRWFLQTSPSVPATT